MQHDRNKLGFLSDSGLRSVMWLVILGLLAAIAYLAIVRPPQVERAMNGFTNSLVQQFPNMQFGTISQPMTVLFMGTDIVYDNNHRHADRQALTGNSDTMMLVFLNPPRNTISVLNIPRDTEAIVGNAVRKINSANMIGGPEMARDTVSNLLDVHIDHYCVMNVQALVQLVNEVGGVTVEVPKEMHYMDWTGKLKIDLTPGPHTLTGNQAMGFCRFRHDALGDIGRIQRQQIFMRAVTHKMLEPASWLHLNKLLEIAQANIQTDMSNIDIFQCLNFAHSVPKDSVRFVMLPGMFAGNGDWIATTESKTVAQRLADPDPEVPQSRRNISVCIVNASSNPRLGGEISRALHKIGYITCVGKDENEPAGKTSRIIAQTGNVADAKMLQQDLGSVGEIINASVGNLLTSITIIAHDDIVLEKITMSSEDAPYVARGLPAQPLVGRPSPVVSASAATTDQSAVPTEANPVDQQIENTLEQESKMAGESAPPEATAEPATQSVEPAASPQQEPETADAPRAIAPPAPSPEPKADAPDPPKAPEAE